MPSFDIPHEYKANRAPMDSDKQRCLDCEEAPDHAYHQAIPEAVKQTMMAELMKVAQAPPRLDVRPTEWQGDSPFWLLWQPPEGDPVAIDIDTPGWVDANKPRMREPGTWFLMAKRTGRPIFSVLLREDDQFYFAKRHVGNLMAAREVLCYGIGKKEADGTTVNLWLMPNGVICGGDDVDVLAARMIG